MLVVYSTIRKGSGEVRDKRARTEIAVQMVRDAIGIDDLEVELVAGEDWTAKSEYSKGIYCKFVSHELDLQKGRIFLAGDAARRMAPTGICNRVIKLMNRGIRRQYGDSRCAQPVLEAIHGHSIKGISFPPRYLPSRASCHRCGNHGASLHKMEVSLLSFPIRSSREWGGGNSSYHH